MAAPRKYPDELRERATRMAVEAIKGADCPGGTIPQPGFDGLRVCVPNRQRILVKQSREFGRVEDIRSHRIYLEEVAAAPEKFVFHVPSSTAHELIRGGALTNAGSAVWSLWDGYLRQQSGVTLVELMAAHDIAMPHLHTSGHASVKDLRRLVDAVQADRVVPIHSEAGNRYPELFRNVESHGDGEWWEV